MRGVLLDPVVVRWSCPACGGADVTREVQPHTRFHACPAQAGLDTPFLRDGQSSKLTFVEREDYVGDEVVQTGDRGRPVMAAVVTRDDGEDRTVYAPAAVAVGGPDA